MKTTASAEVDACSNVAEPSESPRVMPEKELAAAATDAAFAAHMTKAKRSRSPEKQVTAKKTNTTVTISSRSGSPPPSIGESWNDAERSFTKTWPATYKCKWEGKAVTWRLETITACRESVTEKWRWNYNQ